MRPFVVYWNNIPAPYMVERFNALVDRDNLEFEAWFNGRSEQGRSWAVDESQWRFRYRYAPSIRLGGHVFHWPLISGGRRPDLLISLYAQPVFVVGWMMAKLRGAKIGFRVVKTHDSWVARSTIRNAMKRLFFRSINAVETPGEDGRRYAMQCGAREDRIFLATHTVDIPHYQKGVAQCWPNRQWLREQNGVCGIVFMYAGRLWWGKGIDHLLDAFERVQRTSSTEVSLLIVGDGPEEAALRRKCATQGIQNVVFAGFRQKMEMPLYYAMADVFVFPTLGDPYGLVVDEAMACSLPVVSTDSAGEIADRIEEGVNGYVVRAGDSRALAVRMQQLVESAPLRERMGAASRKKIAGHTPDEWAKDFERMVYSVLASA